jgi:hypothetical protein
MLIKLPNGDWIAPSAIVGIRVMVDTHSGPRVVIDTTQHYGHHPIEFDNPEAARAYGEELGQRCNAAALST